MTIGEATNFARTHHDQLIEERSKILDTSQRAPVRSTGPVEAALLAHDVDADLTTLTRNGRTHTTRDTDHEGGMDDGDRHPRCWTDHRRRAARLYRRHRPLVWTYQPRRGQLLHLSAACNPYDRSSS